MTDYKKLGMPLPNEINAEDIPTILNFVEKINEKCRDVGHQQLALFLQGPVACGKTATLRNLNKIAKFADKEIIFLNAKIFSKDYGNPIPMMNTDGEWILSPVIDKQLAGRQKAGVVIADECDRIDDVHLQVMLENTVDQADNTSTVVFMGNGKFSQGTCRVPQNFLTRCATFLVWDENPTEWEIQNGVDNLFFDLRKKIGRPDAYYSCQRPIATALQKRSCFWAAKAYDVVSENKEFYPMFSGLLHALFEEQTANAVDIRFELKRINLPSLNELAEGDARTANDPQTMQAHIDMLVDTATCEFDWKIIVDYSRRKPFAELRKALEERAIKAGYGAAV